MTVSRRALLAAACALPVAACARAVQQKSVAAKAGPTATPSRTGRGTPNAVPLRPEIGSGPRTARAVALTFHGAGDPALATALLAEAERAGARLTVLAVGNWLDAEPQLAQRILRGGHDLGNHTYTHPPLTALDGAAAYDEIARCAAVLRRLTGSAGIWFRPSGTAHTTPTITGAARRAGYRTCLSYDVDSLDYTDPGPDAVVANVLNAVRPGSIVSLHFGHPGTVQAMPAILAGLRSRGLRPVTASRLLLAG